MSYSSELGKSYLLLHIAVFLAGFTGIFGRLVELNEVLITFYRVLFATVLLLALTVVSKTDRGMSKKDKIRVGRTGLLITVHWILFYGSIKYANVSIGVICYTLTSFFTAIFKPMLNRRKPDLVEIGLSAITILGIAIIFQTDKVYQLGILLGVLSSAFAALFTIQNERLTQRYDVRAINYYQMVTGSLFMIVLLPAYLYLFPAVRLAPTLTETIYLLILASVCTIGLYGLVVIVLKRLSAFTVNLSFSLEPIYAIILSIVFFHEQRELGVSFLIGALLILLSFVLQFAFYKRQLTTYLQSPEKSWINEKKPSNSGN